MTKVPVVSYEQVIAALRRDGWVAGLDASLRWRIYFDATGIEENCGDSRGVSVGAAP